MNNSFKESIMSAESQARTQRNFKTAMTNLQKLLPKEYSDLMDQLKIPEIDLSKEEEVESVFTVFMDAIKTCSQPGKENKKVRAVAKRWFEASVPFARIILTVGKSTSAIPVLNICGVVCSGLLVLMDLTQAAYIESRAVNDIEASMEALQNSICRLQIARNLSSKEIHQVADVRYAALNLCTAIFEYLTVAIQRVRESVIRNVFTGSNRFAEPFRKIDDAVKVYNAALADLGLVAILETHIEVQGMHTRIQDLQRTVETLPSALHVEAFSLGRGSGVDEEQPTRQELIDWIAPGDFEEKHRAIKNKRVAGSGTWFLKHKKLQDWLSGSSATSLHCPGCWQNYLDVPLQSSHLTVDSSLVIDELELHSQVQTLGLAYIYLDYKDQDRQSPLDVVASFLKQFACRVDEVTPELLSLYKSFYPRGKKPELTDILEALLAASSRFLSSYVIVDAVDECSGIHRRELLNVLGKLSEGQFKVFTTSRPHIQDILSFVEGVSTLRISADIDDMKNFLSIQLNKRLFHHRELKDRIITKLSLGTDGVFLLGEAQLNYVLRFKDPRNMKTALENSVPAELFDVYETVMESICSGNDDSTELAQKILSWIYHAKRPLKMPEFREAIAIRKTDTNLAEDDLMDPGEIVELCGSLISYDPSSQVVSLSHEKIYEFLTRRHSQFLIPQSDIGKLCLTYLLFETFNGGRCQDESSYRELIAARPLGNYAAQYWGAHVKGESELESEIHALLYKIIASNRLEVIRQLEFGCMVEKEDEPGGNQTLLHLCAKHGLNVLARDILDGKVLEKFHKEATGRQVAEMLSAKAKGDITPLHYAANFGHIDVLDLFLVHNAEVNAKSRLGWSALHSAVMNNHLDIVRRLILGGADISLKGYANFTPLHLASANGNAGDEKMVQLLLNENVEIDPVTSMGNTPLLAAAECGNEATVRMLLHAKADVNVSNDGGFTALHYAASRGHEKMVQLLLNENVEIDPVTSKGHTPLHCAADFGHEATVPLLLHAKADVNISNDSGLTALHYAASRGHEKMVQLLLNENAEIDPITLKGHTPLHCAADSGHEAIVRTLLHTKANVNSVNNSGWTALHFAASSGHVSTVELLLNHALEVPTRTISSSTALHLAAQSHHVDVVDAHLEHVEWVNPVNRVIEEGYSNVSMSFDFRNGLGEPLISAKSLAETRDSWGWTALHNAAWEGHSEVVDKMVSVKDLDIDIQDNEGRTALSRASEKGHLAIVNRLLDTGASLKVTGEGGPLHMAASAGKVDVVECLLRAGAPVDSATKDGVTPLMMASFSGHTTVVKCLLDAKAEVAIKDKKGISAFHEAVSVGNMEIAGLLLPDIFNSPLTSISVVIPVPLKDKLYQHFQLCISALRAYPADQYLHRTLADLYLGAGDRQLALAAYDEALRLNPLNCGKTRSDVLQIGIFCDECNIDPIRGSRYMCIICDDFDLCQQCFRAIPTRHPEHSFLVIPSKSWKESMNSR